MNNNNTDFPKGYMKVMKKKKRKKIRNTPIDCDVTEQKYNDAERVL